MSDIVVADAMGSNTVSVWGKPEWGEPALECFKMLDIACALSPDGKLKMEGWKDAAQDEAGKCQLYTDDAPSAGCVVLNPVSFEADFEVEIVTVGTKDGLKYIQEAASFVGLTVKTLDKTSMTQNPENLQEWLCVSTVEAFGLTLVLEKASTGGDAADFIWRGNTNVYVVITNIRTKNREVFADIAHVYDECMPTCPEVIMQTPEKRPTALEDGDLSAACNRSTTPFKLEEFCKYQEPVSEEKNKRKAEESTPEKKAKIGEMAA